jgi:hypothetical protein
LILIVLVLLAVGGIGWSLYASYQQVTVSFTQTKPGFAVNIYKTAGPTGETSATELIKAGSLVKTVESDDSFKLKSGSYAWETTGNDFQRQTGTLELKQTPLVIVVNPKYTDTKLASLLIQEKPALQKLMGTIPGVGTSFKTNDGKLYQDGTWYGAIIYPNVSAETLRTSYVDVFHVVAHKESGNWKIITNPPDLALSTRTYLNIPRDILVDVNKMTY